MVDCTGSTLWALLAGLLVLLLSVQPSTSDNDWIKHWGWFRFTGKQYLQVDERKNFSQANEHCVALCAKVYTPQSEHEKDFVLGAPSLDNEDTWIDVVCRDHRWVDAEGWIPVWTNWGPEGAHCTGTTRNIATSWNNDGYWVAVDGRLEKRFICEKEYQLVWVYLAPGFIGMTLTLAVLGCVCCNNKGCPHCPVARRW